MRALVTGGNGFLGRYIIEYLLERGYAVTAFQRSSAPGLEGRGVAVVQGNLGDSAAVRKAVSGHDAVFHVAAKAGIWGDRRAFWEANVIGTRNVLAACRAEGVGRLIYTSTPSVVFSGKAFSGADESVPYGRNWLCHYAETKAIAEQEVLAAAAGNLRVCALRPHLIWGIGDPHLLPRVVERARSGRLRIVGDGTNRVDITHVHNAATAHVQALDALETGAANGRAYFLSQGEPVLLWEWLNELLQSLDIPPVQRRISLPAARRIGAFAEGAWSLFRLPGEPPMTRFVATELAKDHWFSIEAARRDLGYRPEAYSTQQGLVDYIAHLRSFSTPS